jgi:hypothetical protein
MRIGQLGYEHCNALARLVIGQRSHEVESFARQPECRPCTWHYNVGRILQERTDFPAGVVNIATSSDHRIGAQRER